MNNEKLVDSEVKAYLRRAIHILDEVTGQEIKSGGRTVIEVAKLIQKEQHFQATQGVKQ